MAKNVMITSAGRRCLLVQAFQRELSALSPTARVCATDLRPEFSSACQLADQSFRVPRIDDDNYIEELLQLCREQQVGLVVPTIDTELLVLSQNRSRFAEHGINVSVSDEEFVSQCRDKRRTAALFSKYGVKSPKIVRPTEETEYPLFSKPLDGSASQKLVVLDSYDDVTPALLNDPKQIFCEYLSPLEHDEYTVDMYFDRDSTLRCLVPRLRIETRAGEVSKGRTTKIATLGRIWSQFRSVDGARGCLAAQFFVRRSDGALRGIEINPRFGGGFPLSYEAGANYPKWLLLEYFCQTPIDDFEDWEDGLTMLRYDSHVLVRSAS